MRYMMLVYAAAASWAQYSTTMTDRACVADSVVFIIAVLAINTSSIISMAWRSNAVARPVIERAIVRHIVQGVLGFMMVSIHPADRAWQRLTNAGLTTPHLQIAAIAMVWWSMIYGQTVGSFLSRQVAGICTSDYTFTPSQTDLLHEPNFWYYFVSILFDATCMVVICISLKKLAKRSTGFSKLISE